MKPEPIPQPKVWSWQLIQLYPWRSRKGGRWKRSARDEDQETSCHPSWVPFHSLTDQVTEIGGMRLLHHAEVVAAHDAELHVG